MEYIVPLVNNMITILLDVLSSSLLLIEKLLLKDIYILNLKKEINGKDPKKGLRIYFRL